MHGDQIAINYGQIYYFKNKVRKMCFIGRSAVESKKI
jgi:hypothetical protein